MHAAASAAHTCLSDKSSMLWWGVVSSLVFIVWFPSQFLVPAGCCSSLVALNASNNRLQQLPDSTCGLQQLQVLALDHNR